MIDQIDAIIAHGKFCLVADDRIIFVAVNGNEVTVESVDFDFNPVNEMTMEL